MNKQGGDFEMEGATYCVKVTKAGFCWTCLQRRNKRVKAIGKGGLCAACLKEGRPKKPTLKVLPKHKQCADCGNTLHLRAMQNSVMRCRPCQTIRTKMLNKIRNDKRYKTA